MTAVETIFVSLSSTMKGKSIRRDYRCMFDEAGDVPIDSGSHGAFA